MSEEVKVTASELKKLLFLNPEDLEANESTNGRYAYHSDDDIDDLVLSFEQLGQEQPVQVKKIGDGKYSLVAGFRRWRAALKFNTLFPESTMQLKCILVPTMDDQSVFLRNLAENIERKNLTPVDNAFNHQRLRKEFGWKDAKIAEFYRVTQAYVCQLKKILGCHAEVLTKLHNGEITLATTLGLADLRPKEQLASINGEKNGSNRETSDDVAREKLRKEKIANGGKMPRTMKEAKLFFSENCAPGESLHGLSMVMLDFLEGKITDITASERLNAILDGERNTESEEENE